MRIFTLMRNTLIADTGEVLAQVHDPGRCEGTPCVVHGPSDHHMRQWPLEWINEPGKFVRICACGCAHPDPDQFATWREQHREYLAWHACCDLRCCDYRCPGPKGP